MKTKKLDQIKKNFFKNPTSETIDVGTQVICDVCGRDWSFENKSGGFLFGSYVYCPDCAEKGLKDIKKYHEEWNIKAFCPPNLSFWNWVVKLRNGNNTITLIFNKRGKIIL